jgi:ferrous iron transport protein B
MACRTDIPVARGDLEYHAPGILRDMLANGIIEGVGGVLVFLPSIMILFLLISLLEDSGYMARAAFIMDRIMHRIGLHGKSFIPMLMGFGCNVPAIMSTRILENRNDRLLTILIIPFMSCSARLPVYVLLIGMIFPHSRSLVLLGLYVLGIALAIGSALCFKRLFFRGAEAPFVMELPPTGAPRSEQHRVTCGTRPGSICAKWEGSFSQHQS